MQIAVQALQLIWSEWLRQGLNKQYITGSYQFNSMEQPNTTVIGNIGVEHKPVPLLTVLHFNDVYDLQSRAGSMGVCNFKARLEQLRLQNPGALTLFSGDAMSPSTLTNIKQGWQMVHALNTLKIDCACFGNHEFDFPIEHTLNLIKATNFPWLLGNIRFKNTNVLLGEGRPWMTLDHNGIKIGLMGVAGEDWIDILNEDYQNMLVYEDCYKFANRTAKLLREEQKCDIVIALTHLRNNVDLAFPKHVKGVDLVLGGHDHVILEQVREGTAVIKSGTNFNHIGLIKLYSKDHVTEHLGNRVNYDWKIEKITPAASVDVQLQTYVAGLMDEYAKYDEVIGYTDVPLETRFIHVRTEQSNYGNFLADLSRLYYDSNVALINSGMVRNDTLLPAGRITYSKISNIINSPMVVKRITGAILFNILQYSVSQYPGFAGQFPFVSGIQFEFDPTATPRVRKVIVNQDPLDINRDYTITTTAFQSRGGDGYQMLKNGQLIVDEIKAITMLNLLLKFFKAADSHQEYESIKILGQAVSVDDLELPTFPMQHLILMKKPSVRIGRIKDLRSRFVLNEEGKKLTSIAPSVDERVVCIVHPQS